MARVSHVGLFSREIREQVSVAALEVLLADATRLTEGQLSGDGHYFGSTMLTIDLEVAYERGLLRAEADVATALRVARLLASHGPALDRLRGLAIAAAERQAELPITAVELDLRVRAEGLLVFVDVDVEARAYLRAVES